MHFAKYGRQEVMKLLEHYTRESSRAHYIDKTRSINNEYYYNDNIAEFEENYKACGKYPKSDTISSYMMSEIQKRSKRKVREDTVLMVDLIITQPKELGQKKDQAFFDKCMNILEKDYIKRDNFIMASIHTDERKDGQPHIHYSFMPFVEDKKKGGEKLCAKEFLNLQFLKSFHKEMEKKTGYKPTLEDGKVRNLTMKEYQNQQDIEKLKSKIEEQEKTIHQLENEKEKKQDTISNYTKNLINYTTSKKIENGTTRYKDCEIKEIEYKEIPQPPKKKTLLGEIIDTEKINDWVNDTNETMKKLFSNYAFNLANIKVKDNILNQKMKSYIDIDTKISTLDTDNNKLKNENETLKEKSKNYDLLKARYNGLVEKYTKINNAINKLGLQKQIEDTFNFSRFSPQTN